MAVHLPHLQLSRLRHHTPRGRDIHEAHRVATPLELLFDLVFVVAIALAAQQLHHGLAENHFWQVLPGFLLSFFAIWWGWMNYAWFASAYDNDDTAFRLLTMLQMVGALVFAAGISGMFVGQWTTSVLGFVVMRVAMFVQWLRAGAGDVTRRRTCQRYAMGIALVQLGWVTCLLLPPEGRWPAAVAMVTLELLTPMWAERAGSTPWHAHHIAERYGLMTIIVLGECVLGTANAIAGVLQSQGWTWSLAAVGLGGMGLVLCFWWIYFLLPSAEALHHHRERAWGWGYGHFFLFASITAMGAGLEVVADSLKHTAADAHAGAAHVPAPLHVITFLAAVMMLFLLSVWGQWVYATRAKERQWGALLVCLACMAAVVLAVQQGLDLAWALPLLCVGPVYVIVYNEHGRRHCAEFFAVR